MDANLIFQKMADQIEGIIHLENKYRSGFRVTFSNYHTLSVVWNQPGEHGIYADDNDEGTVEVAAWDLDNTWLRLCECDDILGHQDAQDVIKLARAVARLPFDHVAVKYDQTLGKFFPLERSPVE